MIFDTGSNGLVVIIPFSSARARGKRGGRPKVFTGRKLGIAQDLYEKQHPIAEICRTLKISKATLYRYVKTGGRDQQSGNSR